VKGLLREGGSNIGEADDKGRTALLLASISGQLETVIWLLQEGGSKIREADHDRGFSAMLLAALFGKLKTVAWLLEHGGANIADTLKNGRFTVWDALRRCIVEEGQLYHGEDPMDVHPTEMTALLRVMVLRGAPPAELTAKLAPEHVRVVQEGARLRARLPAYLTQRRVLLDAHCPLIAPLQDLVHGYEVPTTTDELWATGLGAARQRAARPRADNDVDAMTLRRSARLRQKRK
jgi:hypothetical protein